MLVSLVFRAFDLIMLQTIASGVKRSDCWCFRILGSSPMAYRTNGRIFSPEDIRKRSTYAYHALARRLHRIFSDADFAL